MIALDAVQRGVPRVLAGAQRLDVPVRWVHVIELAQAGHLLRGGELVLSTGIALPPDPDGLAGYVAGLASAGVSALAVELGSRYVRELPRALVLAAGAHRLPLIVFEREVQFIAITEAVHAQILDAQVAELRAAQRLHDVFTGLAVAGADSGEIVRRTSELAGAPVILADLAHRVLACAPASQPIEALLTGFAARSRAVPMPATVGHDPASGWMVAKVGTGQTAWGRLIVVLAGPPDAGAPVLAGQAATALALARIVAGHRAQESPERIAHGSLLAAVAGHGYLEPGDLQARIAALGIAVAGRWLLPVVITLAGPGRPPQPVADQLAASCQDLGAPAICGVLREDRVGALLAVPTGADDGDLLARLASQLRRSTLRPGDRIGAGPIAASPEAVRGALRDAADAADAAAAAGSELPVARLPDLRLTGLLFQLRDDPRLLAFAERQLGPLLRHDEQSGTDLAAVLARYLEAGGNKALTAQRAGLARPTLYQRLRQIEQVLGVPLDTAESRLALHAALLALRVGGGASHGADHFRRPVIRGHANR